MNNKKTKQISHRDKMLVEKIIILDCFASLAMTNKTEKKQRHCGERSDEANRKFLIN
jgi:hypothetical protein